MIKYFLVFSLLIFATSCALPGTQSETEEVSANTTVLYEDSAISLQVPRNWTGATKSDLPSPRVGNIVLALISPEVRGGYANNLIILEDRLSRIMTSVKYSDLNHILTTKSYLEYTKLQEREFAFDDGEISKLYIFEARYNESTPRMKFIQLARVCGNKVYLLHFSLSLDKNPDIYAELFRSFTCK